MKSKFSSLAVLTIALTALVAVGCSAADVEDPSKDTRPLKPVSVITLGELEIADRFVAIGKVIPDSIVEVATAMGGKVTALYVQEGQSVTKGQVLYELDQATIKNNKVQTERSLKSAIATIQDQITSTEKQAQKLKDQIADLKDQKKALEEQPLPNQAASLSQIKSQISQLESTQDTLKTTINTLVRQLGDAKANLNTQITNLEASISDRILKSPTDGVVTGVNFKVGELVGPQNVLRIISDKAYAVESTVTASQLRRLEEASALGTLEVVFYLEGDVNQALSGTLKKMAAIQNPMTNQYTVKFSIDSDSENLYEGEYAEIHLVTQRRISRSLPLAAIKRLGADTFAFYVEGDEAKRVSVTLGDIVGDSVELVEGIDRINAAAGLPLDTQWILKGVDDLQEGAKVSIVE